MDREKLSRIYASVQDAGLRGDRADTLYHQQMLQLLVNTGDIPLQVSSLVAIGTGDGDELEPLRTVYSEAYIHAIEADPSNTYWGQKKVVKIGNAAWIPKDAADAIAYSGLTFPLGIVRRPNLLTMGSNRWIEALQQLHNHLTPDGVLVCTTAFHPEETQELAYALRLAKFQAEFHPLNNHFASHPEQQLAIARKM